MLACFLTANKCIIFFASHMRRLMTVRACLHFLQTFYRVGQKRETLLLSISLPIVDQFSKFFTGTLCRQFAITRLTVLQIPPHRKCVFTLPCEISMKYAYITIITKNFLVKLKKTLQTKIAVNGLYDTKLCESNAV